MEWGRILEMPIYRIAKTISSDTPRARELRQTSPFAGVLSEQEDPPTTIAAMERTSRALLGL